MSVFSPKQSGGLIQFLSTFNGHENKSGRMQTRKVQVLGVRVYYLANYMFI